ncbi:hypothetical protein BCR44DRAFT_1432969 [Catenaria anguillulae PL171]|uniref:Uncharacterized protein n=1 Tax=Catenaria anguillulae PL171 TaxID=765915 RepID=A0A1Y2HNM7_9FUNG|nr:hypothetical protein BCR44DRAFT_1432969 [Catenaria anguillulae PL171]
MNSSSGKAAEAAASFYDPAANYGGAPTPSYAATDLAPSAPPPSYDYEASTATLSLHSSDTLRVVGCDPATINCLRNGIVRFWPRGIQEEGESKVGQYTTYKFKLKGNPWWGNAEESVHARQLMSAIFRSMLESGWRLLASFDSSKKEMDKDTLAFLRSTPIQLASPSDLFSISFNEQDLLRVIGASPEVDPIVHQTILNNPWYPWEKTEAIHSRIMLTQLLARLRKMGYHLYASVDISGGSEGYDTDSWFVVKALPAEF